MRNNVTLIMTRKPRVEFVWLRKQETRNGKQVTTNYYEVIDDEAEEQRLFGTVDAESHKREGGDKNALKAISGRWGTMAVVTGPVVGAAYRGTSLVTSVVMKSFAQPSLPPGAKPRVEQIILAGQTVSLITDGSSTLNTLAEFDTMERDRTDSNKDAWYLALPKRPFSPYLLETVRNPAVEAFHKKMGIRTKEPGKCFLIKKHTVKQKNGNLAGFLVHEAPHPGWLTGCIAPRLKNHREFSSETTSCVRALDVIYTAMGASKQCHLIIVD